ncbi:UNVERIFIED_CONTAM: hypothetical protein Sradi_5365600 [Sesamum radiatum]|uniref:Uncharacterized protein n=1 Tax=Sesamum radiatum TaxID=300843 RepID=A0AAW2LTI3_SESRA
MSCPHIIPVDTIKLVSERLRDKSVYLSSGTSFSLLILGICFAYVLIAFAATIQLLVKRSDAIEPIISLSLFPVDFSVKDKVTNWVRIFSGFDKVEVKALEKILEQKQRLQQEMQKYLSLRQLSQEGDGTEIEKKVMFCFRVMSRCFTDPAKAEESFQILDQLKDSNIWKILLQLLNPDTSSVEASNLRIMLKEILLEAGVKKSTGSTDLILSCMTILVILARFCPLLLGGIEEDLVPLLEDDNEIIKEGTLHILAKAGGTIREQLGVSSRSLDLILERICIEGSRRQAKYAVHALASITKDDGLMSLSVLYKRLVDLLEEKSHLPAVLQSLGCIAQAAMPVFETRESEVEKFIKANILELGHIAGEKATGCWDDSSELCSLKIFGIKALVKSYLPVKDAHLRSGIDGIIEILKNILLFGDISREINQGHLTVQYQSLVDKAHLKLAAAKAILRLSKHWEHKIPVDVLYLALRTSEVHQYVRDRILDPKYACAFLLDISSESDLEEVAGVKTWLADEDVLAHFESLQLEANGIILYDDGDVEVLRLERERWELIENALEAKRSGSSKGLPPKGGSLSSEVRKRRTAGKSPKQRPKVMLKSKSFRESGGSQDGARPEFTSSVDDSGSENERTEKSLADEELSDKDHKQEQDVEKGLSDAEEPKDDEKDSEDTESDNLHRSPHDAYGSDNEAISSSDKKQPNKNNEESADEADSLHSHATASEKLDKKTSDSDSSDTELSDNEPLVLNFSRMNLECL